MWGALSGKILLSLPNFGQISFETLSFEQLFLISSSFFKPLVLLPIYLNYAHMVCSLMAMIPVKTFHLMGRQIIGGQFGDAAHSWSFMISLSFDILTNQSEDLPREAGSYTLLIFHEPLLVSLAGRCGLWLGQMLSSITFLAHLLYEITGKIVVCLTVKSCSHFALVT